MLCFQWGDYSPTINSLGRFCKFHEGHALGAMSEYGRFEDE
jgi:hypothetical protein